ncbi:hypothetical protein [Parabacteroides pacaensis]|uniref:hypothetical protein n=2 Tax=Parabacteroides pacaensis TaxID=2086575 RepID=UPI000D0F7736|nr:hypothetical protein [Parabacteroides pacaensis]
METPSLQPHNVVETPLSTKANLTLHNLLKFYCRFILQENKDIIFFDTLKDSLPLDENIKEHYLDVPLADKIDFFKSLSYFCKNFDTLIKNEKVHDWIWDPDQSPLPFRPK